MAVLRTVRGAGIPLKALTLGALLLLMAGAAAAAPVARVQVDVSANAGRPVDPAMALGAGVDGAQAGEINQLLTPGNARAMRGAGLSALTYRLRTELGIEAWHWNPDGQWSDPAHAQGYWTSSDRLGPPIQMSWGYRLPRRGDTVDNANNVDWSRLTDGDPATFWKSNPYLDVSYTREAEGRPQWAILRLDAAAPVDTVEIAWGEPYARRYEVQTWEGVDEYDSAGRWVTLPGGAVTDGRGGVVRLKVSPTPRTLKHIRILLEDGSRTAPPGADDPRDRLGFAIRELGAGTTDAGGVFHDLVRHLPSHTDQTYTHVSSTDPWHRAEDLDRDLEQAGLDRIFASGLTQGLPVLLPVGVMFDTPDNAAALVRYVRARGYAVRGLELGEEPDGQYGDPADYGALYLQAVDRLRPLWPDLPLGGPSLQSALSDVGLTTGADRSWNSAFIRYLKSRGRLADLQFFSFEYYPFDDLCGDIPAKLKASDQLMDELTARLAAEGVSTKIPWYISEYGFSAYSGRPMVEPESALLMGQIVGRFLARGGTAAYMFGYGPNWPINQHQACAGFGNMMLFTADSEGQAKDPMPSYHMARLLSGQWLPPGRGPRRVAIAEVSGAGDDLAAYVARGPGARTAVLILNRNPTTAHQVELTARDRRGEKPLAGAPARLFAYGPVQYQWQAEPEGGRPVRNRPPSAAQVRRLPKVLTVPANSVLLVVTP